MNTSIRLPDAPPDGGDLPCQWGQLTTTGPAIEWPQDDYHRSVLAIGVHCDRPADRWATHSCPCNHTPPHSACNTECEDHPHPVFTICTHHAVYSYPMWKTDDIHGMHGVATGILFHAGADWEQWWEEQMARRNAHGAPFVLEPTLF